jgi:hypothetical protein
MLQGLADALDQRRERHRAEIALQRRVVQVVGDGNLPVAVRDELLRRRIDRAQRPMKRRQIDDVAAQVVRLRAALRHFQTVQKNLRHVIDELIILHAAVGDVAGPAQRQRLDGLRRLSTIVT